MISRRAPHSFRFYLSISVLVLLSSLAFLSPHSCFPPFYLCFQANSSRQLLAGASAGGVTFRFDSIFPARKPGDMSEKAMEVLDLVKEQVGLEGLLRSRNSMLTCSTSERKLSSLPIVHWVRAGWTSRIVGRVRFSRVHF